MMADKKLSGKTWRSILSDPVQHPYCDLNVVAPLCTEFRATADADLLGELRSIREQIRGIYALS